MRWLRQLWVRRRMYDDLAEEMQQHLEEKIENLVGSGMARKEAEQQARREFGNALALEEQSREEWQWPTVESIGADVKFSLRQLRKSPGFTAVAILTLALGIGASTAVFSLFDAVVLRPLPYAEPDRLLLVSETVPKLGADEIGVSAQEAIDYTSRSQSFAETGVFEKEGFNLTGAERPLRINAAAVSPSVFSVLRVAPSLGRIFTADEARAGAPHVAVISASLWRNLYHSDPHIVGRPVKLDEAPYTIIGVMPSSFQFPFDGDPLSERADLWVPLVFSPVVLDPSNRVMEFGVGVIARLKPGVSTEQGRAGFTQIAQAFQAEHPDVYANNLHVEAHVYPFAGYSVRKTRPVVILLVGAVICVLLIACSNVANLLLARANHRGREMAIRSALGARRARLLRQCLIEALVLSLAGAVPGLLLAGAILAGLRTWGPSNISRLHDAAVNPLALLFALGLSVVTAVLFGFIPAWKLSHSSPQATLKDTQQPGASRGMQRLQDAVVVAEVALAVVLLIGGGLLVRSFVQLMNTPSGFDVRGVTVVRTLFDRARYADSTQRRSVQKEALARLAQLPGVSKVAAASHLPLADERQIGFLLEHAAADDFHWAANSLVSSGYFSAMGIPLLRGRDFNEQDTSTSIPVAVVSESFVREFLRGIDPIGQRFQWGPRGLFTIVGVAGDVRTAALDADPPPMIYLAMFQVESGPSGRTAFLLRTSNGQAVPFEEVQNVVWSLDRDLPLYNITSLEGIVGESLAQRKFTILLLSGFALVAVTLSMIGLFGVLSYLVGRREREIGVRMALGANRGTILTMVLRRGLGMAAVGCGIGLILSFAATNLLRASLYQVNRFDPITLVCVPLLALLVAAAAVLIPARRAAAIEPMQALRAE
ncbi:MAG TPA: ABC transporter permease [Terriglobales bacterium]|nr:ABC transporter permease [Terriglobales bacterium]